MRFLKLRAYIKTISRLPSKKAMRCYFEERTNKMFSGRRATIVTRIKEDNKKKRRKTAATTTTTTTTTKQMKMT